MGKEKVRLPHHIELEGKIFSNALFMGSPSTDTSCPFLAESSVWYPLYILEIAC